MRTVGLAWYLSFTIGNHGYTKKFDKIDVYDWYKNLVSKIYQKSIVLISLFVVFRELFYETLVVEYFLES